MPVINRVAEFHDDMTAWRHDLHRHPELGLQEHRTSAVVAERLRAFGVDEVVTGLATTGVVGVIRGRQPGGAIGLRADMDALPILEETGVPYASATPGVMHACGHDGHTAMLLGAARYLAETRNFAGTVYVIFQPAEEGLGGGRIMVDEGLFERFPMQQVFGLHNWPAAPEGVFLWRPGPIMAAAHIITGLQTIVARNVDPVESGVITIGSISGGHANNVIPESVRMSGTGRWFLPEVGDVLENGVRRIATGMAGSFGATAEVDYERVYIATVNDPAATDMTVRAAQGVAGVARVQPMTRPTMGGEDFGFMLAAKQGSYIILGGQRAPGDPQVHHPKYDFNDNILPVGASYWATLAEQLLPAG
jgi:hippurate hydrolase